MDGGEGTSVNGSTMIRRFFEALASDQVRGHEEDWYTPDVYEVVWPHPLLREGSMRDLGGIREAGRRLVQDVMAEEFEVIDVYEAGEVVIAEVYRRLDLRTAKGATDRIIRMNAVYVFTLREGRICRLQVYPCQHA
jgi:ketosteroid isomerase-like protein